MKLMTAVLLVVFTCGASQADLANRYSFSETGGGGTVLVDSVGGAHATIVDLGGNDGVVGGGQATLAGGDKAISDYVALPADLLSPYADATVELWATQHSVQNWSRLFDFGSSTTNNLLMAWTQRTNLNSDRAAFKIGNAETNGDNFMAPYELDVEYHLAMVIDDDGGPGGMTNVGLYRDGRYRGSFDTEYDLSQLVETSSALGRSQYEDATANASWNEFRIYDGALTEGRLYKNFLDGPDDVDPGVGTASPPLDPIEIIGDWTFARTVAIGEAPADGRLVAAGDLYDDAGNHGGAIYQTPKYAAYAASELDDFAGGGDGFALNTGGDAVGLGYVYFNGDADLAENDGFSFWGRVKQQSNLGGDQFLFSRPRRYDLRVDDAGNLLANFGGVVTDTGYDWTPDEWHDLGVVYSGRGLAGTGLVEVFVDGASLGRFDSGAFDTGDWFHVGAGPGGGNDFHGLFDRVLFFDGAVDAATIATLTTDVPELLWTGAAGDGLWSSSNNWDPLKVPNAGHACVIATGTVAVASPGETKRLHMGGEATLRIEPTGMLTVEGAQIEGVLTGGGTFVQAGPVTVDGELAPDGSLTIKGKDTLDLNGALSASIDAAGIDRIHLPPENLNRANLDLRDATLHLRATGRATIAGKAFGKRSLDLIVNEGEGGVEGVDSTATPESAAPLGTGVFFLGVRFDDGISQIVTVDVFQAAPGDQDGDAKFDFDDVFSAFAAGGGLYETGATATWTEGDFDGDADFDFDDVFFAFSRSGRFYDAGPYYASAAVAQAAAVPEPSALGLAFCCLLGLVGLRASARERA